MLLFGYLALAIALHSQYSSGCPRNNITEERTSSSRNKKPSFATKDFQEEVEPSDHVGEEVADQENCFSLRIKMVGLLGI